MNTRATKLLFAAAITAASSALCGQTPPAAASTDTEEQLLAQITQLRVEGGPNPQSVIDPLRALALLYEESEDYVLAVAALEEARFVTRIHKGLSSADEALLLRDQIRSEEALDQHDRVWEHEQAMVTIARQHHDDIRMAPIFSELASDRAAALEEYRTGGFPPEIELGCYYVPWDPRPYHDQRGKVRAPSELDGVSCSSGQSSAVVARLRQEILTYYADAIEVFLENEDFASQELRDLEIEALRVGNFHVFSRTFGNRKCRQESLNELVTLPLLRSCLQPVIHYLGEPVGANIGGWVSLVRLIAYEVRSDAPAAALGNAMAELADWHLASTVPDRRRFEGGETARQIYERAYREVGRDDEARTSIFSPAIPVTLPAYEPNPLVSAEQSSRYIDVSFEITKYGVGERIKILDTSKGATRAEQRDLVQFIESGTFRPRFVDGKLADSAPVSFRYYLAP